MKPLLQLAREKLIPGVRNSNWAYRDVLENLLADAPDRWLDLGCGHQLMPDWMSDGAAASSRLTTRARVPVGIDADHRALTRHPSLRHRIRGDIRTLPFCDCAFDLVTANMVVEHVEAPASLMREVRRVLRPGGRFLLHTPNRLFYQIMLTLWVPGRVRRRLASVLESRPIEDVYPTRYRLNTRATLDRLGRTSGFELERCIMINSGLSMRRLGTLALPEVILTSILERPGCAWGRSNIIAVLRAPSGWNGVSA